MAPTLDELQVMLPSSSIVLGAAAVSREEAVRAAGTLLVAAGAVTAAYVDHMLERESVVSTFVGDGVAMPHATRSGSDDVIAEGLSLQIFAEPIDWAGQPVALVIGIAAHGRRYITLLSQLASMLLDDGRTDALRSAPDADAARRLLAS